MARTTWMTADGIAVDGPFRLFSLAVVCDAVGAADVDFHLGRDDTGPLLAEINTQATGLESLSFLPGVELHAGLYVNVGSNVTGVSIVWEPLAG